MEWIEDLDTCTGVRRYYPAEFSLGSAHYFRVIPEAAAHDLEYLLELEQEGHWTHLGHYDNDRRKDVHFMTTKPGISLSGWNIFIYPLSQWIEWAKQQQS